jgi:hypothetical protein
VLNAAILKQAFEWAKSAVPSDAWLPVAYARELISRVEAGGATDNDVQRFALQCRDGWCRPFRALFMERHIGCSKSLLVETFEDKKVSRCLIPKVLQATSVLEPEEYPALRELVESRLQEAFEFVVARRTGRRRLWAERIVNCLTERDYREFVRSLRVETFYHHLPPLLRFFESWAGRRASRATSGDRVAARPTLLDLPEWVPLMSHLPQRIKDSINGGRLFAGRVSRTVRETLRLVDNGRPVSRESLARALRISPRSVIRHLERARMALDAALRSSREDRRDD